MLQSRTSVMAMALSASLIAACPTNCNAMWAYVPKAVRILEAEFVVTGRLARLDGDLNRDGRQLQTGIIVVEATIKGNPKVKEIRLAWAKPIAGGLRIADGPLRYKVGQDGIWILKAAPEEGVYEANYPGDFDRDKNHVGEVREQLKYVEGLKWSKAENGLQMAVVHEAKVGKQRTRVNGKVVDSVGRISVYPVMRNTTKKPLYFVNYYAARPLKIEFIGPGKKAIDVPLYGNQRPNPPAPNKWAFLRVPAGQSRMLPYGFGLPALMEYGTYSVSMTYTNKLDGETLNIRPVWRGTLASATLSIQVDKP